MVIEMARRALAVKKSHGLPTNPLEELITPEIIVSRKQKLSARTGVSLDNWPTMRKIMVRREKQQ